MNQTDIFDNLQSNSVSKDTIQTENVINNDIFLFDPIKTESSIPVSQIESGEEKKKEESPKAAGAKHENVVIEDLLGGFSEEVSGDQVVVTGEGGDAGVRSTTSFFLLDLDDNNAMNKDHFDDIIDQDVSLSSAPSEVLSIENLPFDEADSEPVSGFFFNDLLTDDTTKPR